MRSDSLRYRCILNNDGDVMKMVPPPHDVSQVAGPIASLEGTPVDCFCWSVGEEVVSYKSAVVETVYDLYHMRQPWQGLEGPSHDLAHTLYQQGIDYMPLMVDHAHRAGIAFYASFRMNDVHHKSEPEGPGAAAFWRAHPEYRLWGESHAGGHYNAAMDYSFGEVRERKLASMEEVARNYAVDGIELDMSREPYFFQPHEAWEKREILTGFLIELRARLQAAGRDIPIMVRTVFGDDPGYARAEDRLRHGGMDLHTWITEGLLDILVLTDLANTFRVDLEPWLSLCREHGIPLYPALEENIYADRRNFYDSFPNPDAPPGAWGPPRADYTAEMTLVLRALTQSFLAQGVSGVYLFNLFPTPLLAEPEVYLRELFDYSYRNKRYHFWSGLPLRVEAMRPPQYHQTIQFALNGEDIGSPGASATLSFRQTNAPPAALEYALNGRDIPPEAVTSTPQPSGRIPSGFTVDAHERVQITLPGTALQPGHNSLAFAMPPGPAANGASSAWVFELDVDVRFGK